MGVGRVVVAALVVLASLPLLHALRRDAAVVIHTNAEPRIRLPGRNRRAPDAVAKRQYIVLADVAFMLDDHVRATGDSEPGGEHYDGRGNAQRRAPARPPRRGENDQKEETGRNSAAARRHQERHEYQHGHGERDRANPGAPRAPAREQPRHAHPEHDRDVDRGVIDLPDRMQLKIAALADPAP